MNAVESKRFTKKSNGCTEGVQHTPPNNVIFLVVAS